MTIDTKALRETIEEHGGKVSVAPRATLKMCDEIDALRKRVAELSEALVQTRDWLSDDEIWKVLYSENQRLSAARWSQMNTIRAALKEGNAT